MTPRRVGTLALALALLALLLSLSLSHATLVSDSMHHAIRVDTGAALQVDAAPAPATPSAASLSPFHPPPATGDAARRVPPAAAGAAATAAASGGGGSLSPAALAFEAAAKARAASPTPAQIAFAAAQMAQAQREAEEAAARPSPPNPNAEVDELLRRAVLKSAADGLIAGESALREFCNSCDSSLYDPETCASKRASCRTQFCNPICLQSMAWGVELEVDCSAAPSWRSCATFAQQVSDASRAVTSQFQAHVCSNMLGLCSVEQDGAVATWLDSHAYGNKYPLRMLPLDSCLSDLGQLHPAVSQATCVACQRVLRVKLRRGTCVPGFSGGFESKTKGALQERCEFVADYISAHAHSLLLELQHAVCSCLGCCDLGADGPLPALAGRQCYFPSRDGSWLTDLVERVTSSVSERIRNEQRAEEQQRQRRAALEAANDAHPHPKIVDLRMEL